LDGSASDGDLAYGLFGLKSRYEWAADRLEVLPVSWGEVVGRVPVVAALPPGLGPVGRLVRRELVKVVSALAAVSPERAEKLAGQWNGWMANLSRRPVVDVGQVSRAATQFVATARGVAERAGGVPAYVGVTGAAAGTAGAGLAAGGDVLVNMVDTPPGPLGLGVAGFAGGPGPGSGAGAGLPGGWVGAPPEWWGDFGALQAGLRDRVAGDRAGFDEA